MNDELLHMALLAAYGNAFLSGAGVPFPSMSALQSVRFRGAGAEAEEGEDAWFARLRRGGCREIGLFFEYGEEDWTRTAFPNGVPGWELTCRYDGSAARWRRYWDGKPVDGAFLWFAEYTEAADPAAREYPDRIGAQARFEHLQALLGMLSQLAGAIRAYDWKARFAALHDGMDYFRSRRLIDASMLPRVYSDEARKLFTAALNAWVFGGMGSWNDEPAGLAAAAGMETMYGDLTGELYRAILGCLKCAVSIGNVEP